MERRTVDRASILLFVAYAAIASVMFALRPPGTFDGRFYYTAAEAATYLAGLSADDRAAYLRVERIDLVLMATYTALFVRVLGRRFGRRGARLGFAPGALDLLETATILRLLGEPGAAPPAYLGALTAAKWTAVYALIAAWLVSSARARRRSSR